MPKEKDKWFQRGGTVLAQSCHRSHIKELPVM